MVFILSNCIAIVIIVCLWCVHCD